MKLSNLRISHRLYAGFGSIVAILAVLVAISYYNLGRLDAASQGNTHSYQVLGEVQDVLESLLDIETGQRGYALTGAEPSLAPLKDGLERFERHLSSASTLTRDNANQQGFLQQLGAAKKQWMEQAIEPALALRRAANADATQLAAVALFEQAGKGRALMGQMRELVARIEKDEGTLLAMRAEQAASMKQLTTLSLLCGGAIALALAACLAVWLARSITRPLAQAVTVAQRVASGDLTSQVVSTARDETGQLLGSLRDMNEGLIRIVSDVRRSTETISTAATQIASGNLDLSSRTEQQASALEQTASTMEQLTTAVQNNSASAREANDMAQQASQTASQGGSVVSEVVDTMASINESSRKIFDIISVIDGIAFQTNILALNAAVEAARAGEQGRGFAVVATEVRNLAQRSAAAAKEIKALIGDSVAKVESGSQLVDQAGSTMVDIVDSVRRVSAMIGDISTAGDGQRASIEQVNHAVGQMEQGTQQNAALVEQAAAASQSMREQALQLTRTVSQFRLPGPQDERSGLGARSAVPALDHSQLEALPQPA